MYYIFIFFLFNKPFLIYVLPIRFSPSYLVYIFLFKKILYYVYTSCWIFLVPLINRKIHSITLITFFYTTRVSVKMLPFLKDLKLKRIKSLNFCLKIVASVWCYWVNFSIYYVSVVTSCLLYFFIVSILYFFFFLPILAPFATSYFSPNLS